MGSASLSPIVAGKWTLVHFLEQSTFYHYMITVQWGIHLTGVVTSPRPILPRAIETGRMSAFPRWRRTHGLGTLLVRQVLVAHGVMSDSELQDPLEQQPAAA